MSDRTLTIIVYIIAIVAACVFFGHKYNAAQKKKMSEDNQRRNYEAMQESRKTRDRQIQIYESMIENNRLENSTRITGSMRDRNSNRYRTVTIGDQVWMAENMHATHDRYGNPIKLVVGEKGNEESPSRFEPDERVTDMSRYGYLYNWEAAMKVCPAGWHLPTEEDWRQLENYLSSQSKYVCGEEKRSIAKSLADTTGWLDLTPDRCQKRSYSVFGTIGDYPKANNASGFSALPSEEHIRVPFGWLAVFWSSTEYNENRAHALTLMCDWDHVSLAPYEKAGGHSVRCIRD